MTLGSLKFFRDCPIVPELFGRLAVVAAAILAAVEDGILPLGMATLNPEVTAKPAGQSVGQDPSSVAQPSPQLIVPETSDNPPGRTKSSVALRRVDARSTAGGTARASRPGRM